MPPPARCTTRRPACAPPPTHTRPSTRELPVPSTPPVDKEVAEESPSPWAGVWIAEDIEQIAIGIKNGDWISGTLGVVGGGLDALALVSDPAGALLQYGIAWLIEYVKPLSE